jgi:two-component system response regulator FixJ
MLQDQTVHVVEDDPAVRESLELLLKSAGMTPKLYPEAKAFLNSAPTGTGGCLVSDVRMPEMTGLELLAEMKKRRISMPTVLMTAFGDVPQAVKAMKLGAVDFLEKPFDDELMISAVRAALARAGDQRLTDEETRQAREKLRGLTTREQEVLGRLLQGKLNKTIAFDLGISVRTVETHRANLMAKTGAQCLSELVRMSLMAEKATTEA